jgi:hypothetical protein
VGPKSPNDKTRSQNFTEGKMRMADEFLRRRELGEI